MDRKQIAVSVALVVLAAFAAVPTMAAALNDPDLTDGKGGPLLKVGSQILATNAGDAEFTQAGNVELVRCTTAKMTGTLNVNNGTEFEATIETATFAGTGAVAANGEKECTGNLGDVSITTTGDSGVPWCLRANGMMKDDEFQLRGGACAKDPRPITVVIDSTTLGPCRYSRSTAISGIYTTEATGDAVLLLSDVQFSREKLGDESVLCPNEGFLDLFWTLEKDNTVKSEPLYIS